MNQTSFHEKENIISINNNNTDCHEKENTLYPLVYYPTMTIRQM